MSLDLALFVCMCVANSGFPSTVYLFLPDGNQKQHIVAYIVTLHINSLHFIIIEYLFMLEINPWPDANEMFSRLPREINING